MPENTGCSDKDKRQRQILISRCSSLLVGMMVSCNLLIPLCSDFSNLLSDIHSGDGPKRSHFSPRAAACRCIK
ncbi:hypothetical protein T11_6190 [Trichinella zimbabwensis]|uniref:Uncharacterized protein n=1 Tax=Trichinella zimbabwensis TaxID=268475 RepID=A0A0V1HXJ4_9BILA|nr:hypothetical protein T11_6190 [Trichinella zimbabwensis]